MILCHFQAVDMVGHRGDNDIDLSNGEELPPRSSTKEPKGSFTTDQVEELGQAFEISQLHISLEKISTRSLTKSSSRTRMTWSKVPIKKRLHSLNARPSTQSQSEHQSADSLSSVTHQLKSLSSVPQQRKRQSSVAWMT